jgi:hypothetical protein
MDAARPVPITDDDWKVHEYPRLELGLNCFDRPVQIDSEDDASGFKQDPPTKVWDKEVGHSARGSLRITSDVDQETVWSAAPPTQVPPESNLTITAMVKTQGVEGKGVFVRLRYHVFVWHPTPHVEWIKTLESLPVSGTTPGWVKIAVPQLHVPEQEFDYLTYIDVVLDGKDTAWLTNVDVDLQSAPAEQPVLEEGSSKGKTVAIGSGGTAAGSAT